MIQYYPGHMAKAIREIKEKIDLIDVVFELVDARVPLTSQNPYVLEVTTGKPRVVIFTKMDKADPIKTKEWMEYFKAQGAVPISINSMTKDGYTKIIPAAREALKEKIEKLEAKGVNFKKIRALVTGIPNVGKSTFINKLVSRKATQTGDTPGVTRIQSWIKVKDELELLDTPGVLWNKFEPEEIGYKLSLSGAIPDRVVHLDDVVIFGIRFLEEHYPNALIERYECSGEDPIALLDHIALKHGARKHGQVDYNRVYDIFLNDFRSGRLGRITLDVSV